jgi:hypothetical protein
MKSIITCLIFLFALLITIGCKQDTSIKNDNAEETTVDDKKDWTDTIAINYDQPKIEEKVPITEKKDLKSTTKELVATSFNAGKSCAEILTDYEAFLKEISQDLTEEGIKELTKWTNDPLFNDCYNREKSFREKADLLDEMLE